MVHLSAPWRGLALVLILFAGWRPPAVHAPAPVAPAPPGQGAASLEAWRGDLESARREAAERNVVLLVHVILEDEEHNDEYRDVLLPNRGLLQLSSQAVVIVSNNGQHPEQVVREVVDGTTIERKRCSVYPMFEHCGQHNETWQDLYALLREETGELRCPQTLIELPGGKQAWRHNISHPPSASELTTALKNAQRQAGPGLSAEELRAVKQAAFEARREQEALAWAKAWRHWKQVLDLAKVGMFKDEAEAAQEACLAGISAEAAAARELLVPGTAARGYQRLVELAEESAGLPLERELRRLVREAERMPEVREEIARYKLEQEAEELLNEGLAQLEAGDERRAQRTIQRLLRTPKYEGTEAARRAAERFPDWVP